MTKSKGLRVVTERDVIAALRVRFCSPQYAFFEQVGDATGARQKRWADAVALSIWPSRGLELHGFEIKTNLSDWKRELKDPAKSEPVQKYCDRWHVVAPHKLIPPAELPPTWGLIELLGSGKLQTAVEAPKLEAEPLTRSFICAMLRRHADVAAAHQRAEYNRGVTEGAKNGHGELARELERIKKNHEQLVERTEAFEAASGVSIRFEWDAGKIGDAVRLVMGKGNALEVLLDQLQNTAARHERIAAMLREEFSAISAGAKK